MTRIFLIALAEGSLGQPTADYAGVDRTCSNKRDSKFAKRNAGTPLGEVCSTTNLEHIVR